MFAETRFLHTLFLNFSITSKAYSWLQHRLSQAVSKRTFGMRAATTFVVGVDVVDRVVVVVQVLPIQ